MGGRWLARARVAPVSIESASCDNSTVRSSAPSVWLGTTFFEGVIMTKPELPFPDINQLLAQFKLPGVDVDALIQARRKDIEAVVAANRHAYEGMQQLAQRQTEMFKEALNEWQAAAKEMMTSQSPAAGSARQVELGKLAVAKALENMRELAEMATKSQTQAFEVVNRRFHESLDEIKKSIQQKK